MCGFKKNMLGIGMFGFRLNDCMFKYISKISVYGFR